MDLNPLKKDPIPPFPLPNESTILVVTGWRGVGKTIFCQKAVEKYRQAGLNVTGLITPGRYTDHQRDGIFALDLASGVSRLLASLAPGEIDDLHFGPWSFDSNVFEWGNRCLSQSSSTDVLVIDEIGPLEFELKAGWTAGFAVLQAKKYRLAIVVIRPECMMSFRNMGFNFQILEIEKP